MEKYLKWLQKWIWYRAPITYSGPDRQIIRYYCRLKIRAFGYFSSLCFDLRPEGEVREVVTTPRLSTLSMKLKAKVKDWKADEQVSNGEAVMPWLLLQATQADGLCPGLPVM